MDLSSLKVSDKVNFDLNTITILYRHYKDYIIPVIVVIFSILILIFIVNPQINQYFSSSDQLKTQTQKLEVLKNNYNFLTKMSDDKSDKDILSLSSALPLNKDFVSSMNAVSYAASKTGVSVGAFQVNVGNLTKDSGPVDQTGVVYPSIQMQITLGGKAQAIFEFINTLYKTSPVSEISSIKFDQGVGTLVINFYYKQYSIKNLDGQSPIVPFSAEKENTIKEVTLWNNSLPQIEIPDLLLTNDSSSSGVSIASPGASTNGSPF